MRNFYLFTVAAVLAALFTFNSCDKQNENPDPSDNPTPEEYKADITDAVTKTFELIDAQDNKDLLRVLNEAIVLSQYFEPQFGMTPLCVGDKNYVATAAQSTIDLCQMQHPAIRPLQMIKMAKAMNAFTLLYGTYTFNPDTMTWDFSENSDALEFRYPFEGKEVVWKLVFSGEQTVEMIIVDENGQPVGKEEMILPKEMRGAIVWGGTTLYTLDVALDVSKSMDKIEFNLKSDAGGYIEQIVADATPTAIVIESNTVIKGQEVLDLHIQMNGQDMTDQQKLMELMNAYDPLPLVNQMYKNITADAKFMNEVVMKADVKDIAGLIEFYMMMGSSDSTMSLDEMNQRFAELIQIYFCYADTDNVLATVDFQFTEYGMIVTVNFADGTSVPFDEYFDEVFVQDLQKMLEELLLELQQYMPALFGQM